MTTTAPTVPATMLAITQDRLGDPSVLRLAEVETPAPGPSQVLLRVAATGLNPTDWVHRSQPGYLGTGPRTLGWDVAGTVVATGPGVTIHALGDRVFGMLPYPHGHGAAAQYVLAPARALVPKPTGVPWEQAGALPLVGLTAWQALIDTAHLRAGQRALIHAGAGGVGHVAVQIAKARGAHVISTASARNHHLVTSLGADEVIDYTTTDFSAEARDVDVVLDTVGGEYALRSLATLRPGGVIVSLSLRRTTPLGSAAAGIGAVHHLMLVESDHHSMENLASLLRDEKLSTTVAGTYDMSSIDAVREAHHAGETGHVAGKLVLTWGD